MSRWPAGPDIPCWSSELNETAQYGCPYGTLSPELAKRAEGSDPLATPLMQVLLDWAEQKFRAMGRPDAPDLAAELGLPTRAAPSSATRSDPPSSWPTKPDASENGSRH